MMKYVFIFSLFLTTKLLAVDFDKSISLNDCKAMPICKQGLLLQGSWKINGFENSCVDKPIARCDWVGVYEQSCLSMKRKLLNAKDKFADIGLSIWTKKSSYLKNDYPQEVWALIKEAAQFEIDCFETVPEKVAPVLGARRLKPGGISVEGFTEKFSMDILKKARFSLDKLWGEVSQSQNSYEKNSSPRNLSLLDGDFSIYRNASFDEYYNFVKQFDISSKFISNNIKNVVSNEIKFLNESKNFFEKECLSADWIVLARIMNEKQDYCTTFSLPTSKYKEFQVRSSNFEKEVWQSIEILSEDSLKKTISTHSILEDYLKYFPNGMYVKKANSLYEKLLAQQGIEYARKDTTTALSDSSLLKKYLSRYPNGMYANYISSFLEELLAQEAMKKAKSDPMMAISDSSLLKEYLSKYPNGKHANTISSLLEKLKINKAQYESKLDNEYENISEGCSFISKEDDYRWEENDPFPEKNGKIECVKKNDLTLGLSDSFYKCTERKKINVRNGKIFSGISVCVNAQQDTLIKRTYSNGKCKSIMFFPHQITVKERENGSYSISSNELDLEDLSLKDVIWLLSFLKAGKKLPYSYLNHFESVAFEWTSSGYIKNIRIKQYEGGKITSRLNIPLNSKGELHGVSEVYLNSPGLFKVKWENGHFNGVLESSIGSAELRRRLCLSDDCRGLIEELLELVNGEYVIITR